MTVGSSRRVQPRRRAMAALVGALALTAFAATSLGAPGRAAASSSTYYFHGTTSDQVNKTTTSSPSATFDTNAPTGTSPVGNNQQAVWPNDGPNFAESLFDDFWSAPFSGTLS